MFRRLWPWVFVLATIAILVLAFRPDQSSKQRIQELQEPTSAVAPEESHTDFLDLVQRAVAFEMAYKSRYPDDTAITIRKRIAPYSSPQFMSWVALDDDSLADIAFKESGESQEPEIKEKNIYIDDFEDDPTVAFITMKYDLVRKDADGKLAFRIPLTSKSTWVFEKQEWFVYPPE